MASDGVPFACPECDHYSTHRTKYTATLYVAWHFYRQHPSLSFDVGNPLSSETAPSPDEFAAAAAEVDDDGD